MGVQTARHKPTLRVPELTGGADVKLNKGVKLRVIGSLLVCSQTVAPIRCGEIFLTALIGVVKSFWLGSLQTRLSNLSG